MGISIAIAKYKQRVSGNSFFSLSMLNDFGYLFPLSLLVIQEISSNNEKYANSVNEISSCIKCINEAVEYSTFFSSATSLLVTPFYFGELMLLSRNEEICKSSRMRLCNHDSSDVRASMAELLWIIKNCIADEGLFDVCKKNVVRPLAYNRGYLALLSYLVEKNEAISSRALSLLQSREVKDCCLGGGENTNIDPREHIISYNEYLSGYLNEFNRRYRIDQNLAGVSI